MLLTGDMPAPDNPQELIPNHKDRKHSGPRATSRDLMGKGLAKLDGEPATAALDVGVLAVRDMALGEQAAVYETCLGSRVLDCKGCMSGASHWDAAVLAARGPAALTGVKLFADTAASLQGR